MSDYELQGFEESGLEYHKRLLRIEEARAAQFMRESVMLMHVDNREVLLDKARQARERANLHRTAIGLLRTGGKGK